MQQLRDTVTESLDGFLKANGERIVFDTLDSISGHNAAGSSYFELGQRFAADAAGLAAQNDYFRLMLLFRKIPLEYIASTIAGRALHEKLLPDPGPMMEEAVLFGTDLIIRHSPRKFVVTSGARYRIVPTGQECRAALTIMVLCFLHRWVLFSMNALARKAAAPGPDFSDLIDSFNHRLQHPRGRIVVPKTMDSNAVTAFSARQFSRDDRTVRLLRPDGLQQGMYYRNYVPVLIDFDRVQRQLAHLDCEAFTARYGIAFGCWCDIWLALNRVLFNNLPTLWSESVLQSVPMLKFQDAIEKADDFGETGLGTVDRRSLPASCLELLSATHRRGIEKADIDRFINKLVAPVELDDSSFIERPYMFYPIDDNFLFWDYSRNAGLPMVIARSMAHEMAQSGESSEKGAIYERAVEQWLKSTVPAAKGLRRNLVISEGGRAALEIDIGFVLGDVLVAIELKNRAKPQKYFEARPKSIEKRIHQNLGYLQKLDAGVQKHRIAIAKAFTGLGASKALCIVCSDEVEFVPSKKAEFWLRFPDVPRICTLEELVAFLKETDAERGVDLPFIALN